MLYGDLVVAVIEPVLAVSRARIVPVAPGQQSQSSSRETINRPRGKKQEDEYLP